MQIRPDDLTYVKTYDNDPNALEFYSDQTIDAIISFQNSVYYIS
jgi:hypothetical protein